MKHLISGLGKAVARFLKPERNIRTARTALFGVALMAAGIGHAQGIAGSKHDLSTNYDPISNQVCMYCHTPHHANSSLSDINAPLWNRTIDRTKVFTTYSSPTMVSTPGNPNLTVSVLCLGCHDGTHAPVTVMGATDPFDDKHEVINGDRFNSLAANRTEWPNCQRCHPDYYGGPPTRMKLGLDLSNDHPIAVTYPTGIGSRFRTPPDPQRGWSDTPLFNGKVECASCHKVHDPSIPPFLRKSNAGSALCLTCHVK
jgi:predicted CXXCH cytochrome family protein